MENVAHPKWALVKTQLIKQLLLKLKILSDKIITLYVNIGGL